MRVWSGRLKPRTLSVVDTNCAPACGSNRGLRPERVCSFGPPGLTSENSSGDLPNCDTHAVQYNRASHRPIHRCMKPSVSVCIKLTSAFSSSSESPSCPTNLVFMLSVDSGAGQHVVPSPGSLALQCRRTSRVL